MNENDLYRNMNMNMKMKGSISSQCQGFTLFNETRKSSSNKFVSVIGHNNNHTHGPHLFPLRTRTTTLVRSKPCFASPPHVNQQHPLFTDEHDDDAQTTP